MTKTDFDKLSPGIIHIVGDRIAILLCKNEAVSSSLDERYTAFWCFICDIRHDNFNYDDFWIDWLLFEHTTNKSVELIMFYD